MPTLVLALLALLAISTARPAHADCSTGRCIPGGGDATLDCAGEYFGAGLVLNYPFPDPNDAMSPPSTEVRCFDGDAGCDLDGEVNGVCRFPVDVCVHNSDPNLGACSPSQVTAVAVSGGDADTDALEAALAGLSLPADAPACTQGGSVDVTLVNATHPPTRALRTGTVALATTSMNGDDADDVLTLSCLPRDWPSHGYNHYNHRATKTSRITPANVDRLQLKWEAGGGSSMSATPTVTGDKVYGAFWNGFVVAYDRESGAELWSFDTEADQVAGALGVQSSVTVLPDGRVLVGDSEGRLHCLDGDSGALLWTQALGDPVFDHIWASPTVANGRVFMGVASHNDEPCTQGRLVALDVNNGDILWTTRTAPDRICENDTTLGCTTDLDCAGVGGLCVGQCTGDRSIPCQDDVPCAAEGAGLCGDAVGGGVTATTASDVTGETVFMVSVGCFTSPRVGNSDRIFSLRAEDGSVDWAVPDLPGEPFQGPGGTYQDYGFLNGPIVVNDPVEPKIVAAGKDGFLYAREPATGAEIWTNDVGNVGGAFAAFGLFNGAPAFAEDRLFTSLYQFADGSPLGIVHTQAFAIGDGQKSWDASFDVEPTFGSVGYADGVVFVGSSDLFLPTGSDAFYAFDAGDGTLLATFDLPMGAGGASSGPSIVDDELFLGFGLLLGGIRAYELAPEGAVSKDQMRCVGEVNKRMAGVAKGMGKELVSCVKARSAGKTADDLLTCALADPKGKLGKARAKTTSGQDKKCDGVDAGGTAGFVGDADAVNDAAQEGVLAVAAAVFGSPDGLVQKSGDKDGARCQQEVAKRTTKLLDTLLKEANKAKKKSQKDSTPDHGTDVLGADVAAALVGAKAQKAATSLAGGVAKKCAGLDLAALFPGACGGAVDFPACATECATYHACRALDGADGLVMDCAALAGGDCG